MDSQSAKTTSVGGIRGYDGGKKLSGRKRHLLVDTLGLVLTVTVHAADIQDRAAVSQALADMKERFERLAHIWLDQGYTGAGKAWIEPYPECAVCWQDAPTARRPFLTGIPYDRGRNALPLLGFL
jgi:putative transposase